MKLGDGGWVMAESGCWGFRRRGSSARVLYLGTREEDDRKGYYLSGFIVDRKV